MEFLKNKLKEKERKYQRRKFKTNTKAKITNCGNRVIVSKTNMYVLAQLITSDGKVLIDMADKGLVWDTKTARAENLWLELAKNLKEKWIEKVTFDRNGFLYHWRVKAVAEWLRKWGIEL